MRMRMTFLLGLIATITVWQVPASVADPNKASRYTVPMSGGQVVPGPGDADGEGGLLFTLQRHSGRFCWIMDTANISPHLTAVDLHHGARGSAGELVQNLAGPVSDPDLGDCIILENEVLRDIEKYRENYYVDVHNDEYPNGALRAQLG